MNVRAMKGGVWAIAWVGAFLTGTVLAGERIVHLDEMDGLATRTERFNEGAGVRDARKGSMMLVFTTDEPHDFHKRYFPIERSPVSPSWSLTFRFRMDRPEALRAFGLRLYFGDRARPETRLLNVREAGSYFEGAPVPPPPAENALGFLRGRARRVMARGTRPASPSRGIRPPSG